VSEHSLPSAVRRLVISAVGDACVTTQADDSLAIQPPADSSRQLIIHFRHDGDIDVGFALQGVKGSPFEQHFIVHETPPADAAAAVVHFVSDLVAERIVVAHVGGWKGGRKFIAPRDTAALRRAAWTASWLRTYDRNVPQPER
jgi:hypothetical protein